jgi:hypothetical protein
MPIQLKHDSETLDYPLVLWTSLIAAGVVTVIWKVGFSLDLNYDSIETFFLFSFLGVEQIAGIFVYIRAEKQHLRNALLAIFVIPVWISVIALVAVLVPELVYGRLSNR